MNLRIGSANYGTVVPGAKTDYKPVDEGTHMISGFNESWETLSGSVVVSGNGTHKRTLIILSSETVELVKDK